MRKCVADIHNSATKIKLVLKKKSFSFLDIARFEEKLETEWKHDMLKLSNMPKNQDNDKIIWFIIWSSIKLHGQREFRGLDSTPFVEKIERKFLENFNFCKTGQIDKIFLRPKYACGLLHILMLLFQMVEVVVVRSTVEHLLYPVAGVEPVRIVLQMYNNINTPEKYINTTPSHCWGSSKK